MDKSERARLKQLANDAIIATFGYDNLSSQLATALENCISELEDANSSCPTCSKCENHGDHGDEFTVDVNEIVRVHGELKKRVAALKDLHGKFDDSEEEADLPELINELALQVEEFEDEVDELEAEVTL